MWSKISFIYLNAIFSKTKQEIKISYRNYLVENLICIKFYYAVKPQQTASLEDKNNNLR